MQFGVGWLVARLWARGQDWCAYQADLAESVTMTIGGRLLRAQSSGGRSEERGGCCMLHSGARHNEHALHLSAIPVTGEGQWCAQ